MRADAQGDGRPAEYRRHPVLNVVDQIAKIFAHGKISLGGKNPRKYWPMYSVPVQETL